MQKSHGFIAFFLAALASPAIAASPSPWQLVLTRQTGDQVYLNVDTLQRKGAIVSFDSMERLAKPGNPGIAMIGYQGQTNCAHGQVRYSWATSYDNQGQIQAEQKIAPKWKTIKATSPDYALIRRACEKKKR